MSQAYLIKVTVQLHGNNLFKEFEVKDNSTVFHLKTLVMLQTTWFSFVSKIVTLEPVNSGTHNFSS